ncbi:MAG: aldo/keto reductase [Acetobacteraceae bacterium]|nr:aldo/keto reductase [Acetobacteraceae bacterium]
MERRDLFKSIAATALIGGTAGAQAAPEQGGMPPLPVLTDPGERRGDMLYRKFGATGVSVSAIGFGGSHFAKPGIEEAESIRLCHEAIDRGITFMDNSWDYNKGTSEERMGKALAQGGYRDRVFLMSKVDGRTRQEAQKQLDESLQRLRTDRLDLWQFHEIIRYEDPDRIFDQGGAIETALDAKKAGRIRFIGFTGHKDPHIHNYMLDVAGRHGFHFDAVLFPSNVMDAHFRSFAREFMPRAVRERLAIQTMKPLGGADGVILKSGAPITGIDCLHYALNLPTAVVITGIDNRRALDQAFEATRTFKPMLQAEIAELLSRTAKPAQAGQFELFKTSAHFDSTAQNPDWLGGEDPEVQRLAPKKAG